MTVFRETPSQFDKRDEDAIKKARSLDAWNLYTSIFDEFFSHDGKYELSPAVLLEFSERLKAQILSVPSHARQSAYWLIERNSKHKYMPPTEPVLWFKERLCFAQGDKDIWTPHADKARHFATKAEAEEYVRASLTGEDYDPAPDVTDHMDCSGPTHAEIDASVPSTTPQIDELLSARAILRKAFAWGIDLRHKKGCTWAAPASNLQKGQPCRCGRDELAKELNSLAFHHPLPSVPSVTPCSEITSKMEEAGMAIAKHDLGFGVPRAFVSRVFKAMRAADGSTQS